MDFASLLPPAPAANSPSSLGSLAAPSADGQAAANPLSPANPLFAYALVAAVTFGLMAFSTSVRVGHTTAALKVGNS